MPTTLNAPSARDERILVATQSLRHWIALGYCVLAVYHDFTKYMQADASHLSKVLEMADTYMSMRWGGASSRSPEEEYFTYPCQVMSAADVVVRVFGRGATSGKRRFVAQPVSKHAQNLFDHGWRFIVFVPQIFLNSSIPTPDMNWMSMRSASDPLTTFAGSMGMRPERVDLLSATATRFAYDYGLDEPKMFRINSLLSTLYSEWQKARGFEISQRRVVTENERALFMEQIPMIPGKELTEMTDQELQQMSNNVPTILPGSSSTVATKYLPMIASQMSENMLEREKAREQNILGGNTSTSSSDPRIRATVRGSVSTYNLTPAQALGDTTHTEAPTPFSKTFAQTAPLFFDQAYTAAATRAISNTRIYRASRVRLAGGTSLALHQPATYAGPDPDILLTRLQRTLLSMLSMSPLMINMSNSQATNPMTSSGSGGKSSSTANADAVKAEQAGFQKFANSARREIARLFELAYCSSAQALDRTFLYKMTVDRNAAAFERYKTLLDMYRTLDGMSAPEKELVRVAKQLEREMQLRVPASGSKNKSDDPEREMNLARISKQLEDYRTMKAAWKRKIRNDTQVYQTMTQWLFLATLQLHGQIKPTVIFKEMDMNRDFFTEDSETVEKGGRGGGGQGKEQEQQEEKEVIVVLFIQKEWWCFWKWREKRLSH